MFEKTLRPAALLALWLAAPAAAASFGSVPERPSQNAAQGQRADHAVEQHRAEAKEREAHDPKDHAKRPARCCDNIDGKHAEGQHAEGKHAEEQHNGKLAEREHDDD